ncbi:MAG: class I SAM-dependent methyltransferase [Caulobacterales bacterium]|nr:class I SAM-dependent methyltransferase [Caulobacterales bacterium]
MQSFEEFVAHWGPWTTTNIEFKPGRFTMGHAAEADWPKLRATWIAQLAEFGLRKPLSDMRVLDIGCFEGGVSHNLAVLGAKVVGLEARETNLRRCEFVAQAAGLSNVRYVLGDMLRLDDHGLGEFDLIVASGVLYHIDAPDLLPFLKSVRAHCRGVVHLDTHVALEPLEAFEPQPGLTVYGRSITEHTPGTDDAAKDERVLSSFRNNYAFWLTERSLMNMLNAAGFSMVLKPMLPMQEWNWRDRGTWIADARTPLGHALISAKYRDPDPRMHTHPQFDRAHHMTPGNPATADLY